MRAVSGHIGGGAAQHNCSAQVVLLCVCVGGGGWKLLASQGGVEGLGCSGGLGLSGFFHGRACAVQQQRLRAQHAKAVWNAKRMCYCLLLFLVHWLPWLSLVSAHVGLCFAVLVLYGSLLSLMGSCPP